MNEFVFHTISLFYPARCPLCSQIVQRRGSLCQPCAAAANRITQRCTDCGCPSGKCSCINGNFELNLAAPFEYDGAVRSAIHRFKFRSEKQLAHFFGDEMSKAVREEFSEICFDFAVCVPQTKRRRRERGYNQAALLAKRCAKRLGIPAKTNSLIKLRDTAYQHSLKAKARLQNVKGVFAAKNAEEIKGKTILLCDDIKTTGATLNECRKILLKAGAAEVYCTTAAVATEKVASERK